MRIIGGVEIGTSKITVLVGELTSRSLTIIGKGECQSLGIVKGVVTDIRSASSAVHTALQIAEKQARMPIQEIYLAQTGRHLEGFPADGVVSVSSANRVVSPADIDTACRLATSRELPENRTIIQQIRRPFTLDGNLSPKPEYTRGQRLVANYWIVHGDADTVSNNIHIIRDYNLEVSELILSSLASAEVITTPEERQHGILALDIGAGATDYVLYRHGSPHLTGVVAVGGQHINNDLILGLRLTEGQAETVKQRHARATNTCRDKNDKIWLDGTFAIGDRQLHRQSIEQITTARIAELFEIIRKKLGHEYTPENIPAGVVITGGTSKLPGITDAAQTAFGVPARLGEIPPGINEQLRAPGYATALGLLHIAAKTANSGDSQKNRPQKGFLRNLLGI